MNLKDLCQCVIFVVVTSLFFIKFGLNDLSNDLEEEYIFYDYKKDFEERKISFDRRFNPSYLNESESIATSGALKLRIPEEYISSLNFSYLIEKQTRIINRKTTVASKVKTILHWNPDKKFLPVAKYLTDHSGRKCNFITRKMIRNKDDVDAIIFIARKIFRSKKKIILPTKKSFRNAKFVFTSEEAPIRFTGNYSLFNGLIDYTYTHRKDSDICKSFYVQPKETINSNSEDIRLNYAEGKTRMAAWFVSNCNSAPSLRMRLVETLRVHGIAVDIYGRCGQFKCEKEKGKYCYKMIERIYKFYLSFENSLCNHYVTEKFTNILNYNIVPVTYGLGHELTGVPKHGYVDVLHFKDVKSVADHLIYLDKNDTAYNEYFRWKSYYKLPDEEGDHNMHSLKKVCEALHDNLPSTAIGNLRRWFEDGQCVRPKRNDRLLNFLRGY